LPRSILNRYSISSPAPTRVLPHLRGLDGSSRVQLPTLLVVEPIAPTPWPLCGCWIWKDSICKEIFTRLSPIALLNRRRYEKEIWTQEYIFDQKRRAKIMPRVSFRSKPSEIDASDSIFQCHVYHSILYSILVLRLLAASLMVAIKTHFS